MTNRRTGSTTVVLEAALQTLRSGRSVLFVCATEESARQNRASFSQLWNSAEDPSNEGTKPQIVFVGQGATRRMGHFDSVVLVDHFAYETLESRLDQKVQELLEAEKTCARQKVLLEEKTQENLRLSDLLVEKTWEIQRLKDRLSEKDRGQPLQGES